MSNALIVTVNNIWIFIVCMLKVRWQTHPTGLALFSICFFEEACRVLFANAPLNHNHQ